MRAPASFLDGFPGGACVRTPAGFDATATNSSSHNTDADAAPSSGRFFSGPFFAAPPPPPRFFLSRLALAREEDPDPAFALMRAASRVSRAASRAPVRRHKSATREKATTSGATPSFGTSRERSVAARRHASGVPRRWSELRARLIMLAARPRADALARDVADARPRPRRRGSSSAASSRAPPPPPPTRARSVSAASASSRPLARATCAARAAGPSRPRGPTTRARGPRRGRRTRPRRSARSAGGPRRGAARAPPRPRPDPGTPRARPARGGAGRARARARADEPARRRPHPRACPPARRPTPRASRGAAVTATRGRGRVVSSVVKAPGTTRAMTILFVGTNDGIRRGFPSRASASSPSRTRHRLHSRDTLLVHGVAEDPPPLPPLFGVPPAAPPSSVVSLRLRAST